jgi:hypothetical protein
VQVIPHITDEIKHHIRMGAGDADVAIVEIGGTVGDIESLPFLEAVRQMRLELGQRNTCYIHLTLVPYIKSAGEIKTKPTQHSVKELREIGIQADALLCRCEKPVPDEERRKIALFTNVAVEAVISVWDADSIYKIPSMLHQQMLDEIVCHKLDILARPADLSPGPARYVSSITAPVDHSWAVRRSPSPTVAERVLIRQHLPNKMAVATSTPGRSTRLRGARSERTRSRRRPAARRQADQAIGARDGGYPSRICLGV